MTAPRRRTQRNKVASPKCRDTASQPPSPPQRKPGKITKPSETTPPKRKMSHQDLLSSLSDQAVRDDFCSMGIPAEKVKALMATAEPAVDKLGFPTRSKEEKEARVDAKEAFEKKLNSPRRRKRIAAAAVPGNQVCPFPTDKNWVLFNPAHGFPPLFPLPGPDSPFQRFAVCRPGNKKILLYNLVSGALKLRCTPESWRDEVEIEYTKQGVSVKVAKG